MNAKGLMNQALGVFLLGGVCDLPFTIACL